VTNSGTEKEGGGQQVGIGPAAAAKRGPAAGLLDFLVGAALLALVGLVAEAGVVETQAIVAAALGRPGGGRAVAARLVAAGRLAAIRRGGSVGVPEGRLLARDSCGCGCGGGGGSGLLRGLGHPEHVATLDHLLRCVEGQRIDQIADVARQFAEEKGGLCILHRRRLQGGEVVPQDGGPGVAAHGIIQPFVGNLLVTKAVGVPRQRADGAISENGNLDMAQWNFVMDWVMFAVAKVESRQSNHDCGESA
jgi:hypothetical protein